MRGTPSLEGEQKSWSGTASRMADETKRNWLQFGKFLVSPIGSEPMTAMGATYGGHPGLPGANVNNPWEMSPYQGGAHKEYSFTSLSGLAEKMQQEASGGGDVQDQQLDKLSKIEENTRHAAESVPSGGADSSLHTGPNMHGAPFGFW
jgi:hypothetical protein